MPQGPLVIVLFADRDVSVSKFLNTIESGFRITPLNYSELFKRAVHGQELLPEYEKGTVLLARQPYVANRVRENYVFLLNTLLRNYAFSFVIDRTLYASHFLIYDDKAYQQFVFEALAIPVPHLLDVGGIAKQEWPVVIKRRVSSRGRGVFLIKNKEHYDHYFERRYIDEHIAQEYVPIEHDVRVLVLGGKVIGVMERKVIHHPEGRLGVRSFKKLSIDFLPQRVIADVLKVNDHLGIDFCGFDVGIKADGSYVLFEYNPTPQFLGFERITRIKVGKQVVEWCLAQAA